MLKLYRLSEEPKEYWETWENDGVHFVHWGILGTRGQTKELRSTFLKKAEAVIQKEIDQKVAEGFHPVDLDDHYTLLIEYAVAGMGSGDDVGKRHRLEDRMNETLGWTGLGHCDGGSIGSGTMEACCMVVDFEIAEKVIKEDLQTTEFQDYTRIYDENSG